MSRADKVVALGSAVAVGGMALWMFNVWLDQHAGTDPAPVSTPAAMEHQSFQTPTGTIGPSLGDRGSYDVQTVAPPVIEYVRDNNIPACKVEDGSGQDLCLWDGTTMGNGKGATYIVYYGNFYYLDGAR